jgi:hypothetical protein
MKNDEENAHLARGGDRYVKHIMARKKFYAVESGRVPGIYETWAGCEMQVK